MDLSQRGESNNIGETMHFVSRSITYRALLFLLILGTMVLRDAWAAEAPQVFRFEEVKVPDKSRENLDRGKMALSEELYAQAIGYFQEYLKLSGKREPAYANGTLLLSQSYIGNKEPEKAVAALNGYFASKSVLKDAVLMFRLKLTLGQAQASQSKWRDAVNTLLPLTLRGIPADIRREAIQLCSDCRMKLRDWKGLAAMLNGYVVDVPDALGDFRLMSRLAEASIATSAFARAEELLAPFEAPPLSGEDALLLNLIRIRALSLSGKTAEARKLYDGVLSLMPSKPEQRWWAAVAALSDAYRADKEYQAAGLLFTTAVKLAVTPAERLQSMSSLAHIQILMKEQAGAKNTVAALEKQFPESAELLDLTDALARLLFQLGNYNSAAEYFKKLSQYPHTPVKRRYESCLNGGDSLSRAGKLEDAIAAFLEGERQGGTEEERAAARFRASGVAMNIFQAEKAGPSRNVKGGTVITYYKTLADKYPGSTFAPDARYTQATTLAECSRYKEAADVFGVYARDYPKAQKHELALIEKGICLRKAATSPVEKMAAVSYLSELVPSITDGTLRDTACIEAYRAADEAGNRERAEQELTRVINLKDSAARKDALFMRAMLRFNVDNVIGARADVELFLKDFQDSEMLDELCVRMGDSYTNESNWTEALKYYAIPVTRERNPSAAAAALYETATCYRRLAQYHSALAIIDKLEKTLKNTLNKDKAAAEQTRILPRLLYLKGDVFAEQRNYESARTAYAECRNVAGDTQLGYSALGRQGEMLLEKALAMGALKNDAEMKEAFAEADNCFREIIARNPESHPMALMSNYRLAFSLNRQKKYDEALDAYLRVYFAYKDLQGRNSVMDDFYFANAVFDMAEILENRGDPDSLLKALSYYRKLAQAQLPTSPTAAERVKVIEATLASDKSNVPR